VFIGTEIRLEVGLAAARARMADLADGGLLEGVSQHAYDAWTTGLARVGPLGATPGVSRLVQVHIRALEPHGDSATWAMRWQATGAAGSLFPALDADIRLSPAGQDATILAVSGVYRPPLGGLGAGLDRVVMNRIARASIRAFARQLGTAVTSAHVVPAAGDACDWIKP
jgi:hypothetical protein